MAHSDWGYKLHVLGTQMLEGSYFAPQSPSSNFVISTRPFASSLSAPAAEDVFEALRDGPLYVSLGVLLTGCFSLTFLGLIHFSRPLDKRVEILSK